jgi:ribonuclease HI
MEVLFAQLADDDVIVCGDATACIVPFQVARLKKDQRLFSNSGSAPMGYDLPAAIGAAIYDESGCEVHAVSQRIGRATNNEAEYRAAIAGLEAALALGAREVELMMDSELVVRQLSGRYKVRNPALRRLFGRVKDLQWRFASFQVKHVRREENRRADQLVGRVVPLERAIVNGLGRVQIADAYWDVRGPELPAGTARGLHVHTEALSRSGRKEKLHRLPPAAPAFREQLAVVADGEHRRGHRAVAHLGHRHLHVTGAALARHGDLEKVVVVLVEHAPRKRHPEGQGCRLIRAVIGLSLQRQHVARATAARGGFQSGGIRGIGAGIEQQRSAFATGRGRPRQQQKRDPGGAVHDTSLFHGPAQFRPGRSAAASPASPASPASGALCAAWR